MSPMIPPPQYMVFLLVAGVVDAREGMHLACQRGARTPPSWSLDRSRFDLGRFPAAHRAAIATCWRYRPRCSRLTPEPGLFVAGCTSWW